MSAIMDCDAGVPPASPVPTPNRATMSWANVVAAPQAIVINDQIPIDTAISFRRLTRSAIIPSGIPIPV